MKIEKKVLSNKATILGAPITGAKTVTMAFGFRTGSRNEVPKYAGISHFLEHMMFKGSQKRPTAKEISVEIDKIGANYNAFTSKEYTYYYVETTPENFDDALDVLGDMATRPILNGEELRKERGTIIEEIHRANDNPERRLLDDMETTIFGADTPIGRAILGSEKTVKAIDSKIMKEYFQNIYCAENAFSIIAGHLPSRYQEKVEKYLLNLHSGRRSSWQAQGFCSEKISLIKKKTEQAHLGISFPGYKLSDKKRYAADVASTILGGYMSSRLFTEIREKRGWAYRIAAFHESYTDTGILGIFGGLKLDKAVEAMVIIKQEVLSLAKTLTTEEIERAKGNIKGSTVLKYENPQELAAQLGLYFILENKIETPEEYLKKIEAVTKKDIIAVAEEIFKPENMYLTVIGPFKDKEKFAKILA